MNKKVALKFEYVNWEGKKAIRKVEPLKIWHGSTKWPPKKQWFMKAVDTERKEERDFSLKDIIKFL